MLSDAPTPKTLDIGTAAFHEIWITDRDAGSDRGHRAGADRPPRAHAAARRRRDGAVHRDGARAPSRRCTAPRRWTSASCSRARRGCCSTTGPRRGSARVTRSSSAGRTTPGRTGPISPVRMVFVLIDGTITDELRAAAGPLAVLRPGPRLGPTPATAERPAGPASRDWKAVGGDVRRRPPPRAPHAHPPRRHRRGRVRCRCTSPARGPGAERLSRCSGIRPAPLGDGASRDALSGYSSWRRQP